MIINKYQGRSGNILLQMIGTSIISKKFNLRVEYNQNLSNFKLLGLELNNGTKKLSNFKEYFDTQLMEILNSDSIENGIIYDGTFQVSDFVKKYRMDIINHFNLKYENEGNNDLFVHVRLDDVANHNPGLKYYDTAIESINFNKGYISSDTIDSPLVTSLINKYNLIPYQSSPIETIDFAKNFNNLVLSKGTFSWWIAMLSKSNNIIFSINDIGWYGDIFVFDDWKYLDINKI